MFVGAFISRWCQADVCVRGRGVGDGGVFGGGGRETEKDSERAKAAISGSSRTPRISFEYARADGVKWFHTARPADAVYLKRRIRLKQVIIVINGTAGSEGRRCVLFRQLSIRHDHDCDIYMSFYRLL